MVKPLLAHHLTSSPGERVIDDGLFSGKRLRSALRDVPTIPCPPSAGDIAHERSTLRVSRPSRIGTLAPDTVLARTKLLPELDAGLQPRAMFLLGMVDGYTRVSDVVDASAIAREDAMKILLDLMDRGLVRML